MKRVYGALAAVSLLGASAAWAVKPGDKLYVKSAGKILKEAKNSSSTVGQALNVGDEVTWQGADDKDKSFQKVTLGKTTGFLPKTALSVNKPQPEIVETGKSPIDAKAFASSGAATKALTPAGVTYAKDSPSKSDAAAEIIYAEQHNFEKATPAAIAAKAKELGGGK